MKKVFVAIAAIVAIVSPAMSANLVLPGSAGWDSTKCPVGKQVGSSTDYIDGRAIDYAKDFNASQTLTIDLDAGTGNYGLCYFTFAGFRNIHGSPNSGSYYGNGSANIINGNGNGGFGADYIDGLGGNDTLKAVTAGSAIFGGSGTDNFTVRRASDVYDRISAETLTVVP